VTGSVVLVVALGLSMVCSSSRDPTTASGPLGHLRPSASDLALAVNPPSWWLTSGNTTELAATWTGIPPGCEVDPLWFRWTIARGFAEGTLGPIDGSTANFTAASYESGTAEVEARSAVVVTCGTDQLAKYGSAEAAISVVAPLRLENVSLAPDLVPEATFSNLSAVLVGGQPPYRLRIDWGDGNVSDSNASAPGLLSFAHQFPSGSFSPTILVSDAAGLLTNGSVDGPISASSGLAVAVDTPTVEAEVGVPVLFSGEILNPPAQFGSATLCADTVPSHPISAYGNLSVENFTCTFASAGPAEVDFEVVPINDDLPPVEAHWSEPVVPRLALNVSAPPVVGEVGLPTVFTVRLSGGVPPFLLTWRLAGNSTAQEELAYADGWVQLPVWPSEFGTYALTATVTDALGVLVATGSATVPVDPPLNASATVDRILGLDGAVVRVAGTVTQGTAPFLWWVLPG
jgi:hypothetical protein